MVTVKTRIAGSISARSTSQELQNSNNGGYIVCSVHGCGVRISRKESMNAHMQTHEEETREIYQCTAPRCGATMRGNAAFDKHMKTKHTIPNPKWTPASASASFSTSASASTSASTSPPKPTPQPTKKRQNQPKAKSALFRTIQTKCARYKKFSLSKDAIIRSPGHNRQAELVERLKSSRTKAKAEAKGTTMGTRKMKQQEGAGAPRQALPQSQILRSRGHGTRHY